jgi:hypothetical protein
MRLRAARNVERIDFASCVNYAPAARSSSPTAKETNMKTLLRVVGLILIMMGGIWFLQGINILPGSFMTGQIRWAVYGGIAVSAGIVLLVTASRRRAN